MNNIDTMSVNAIRVLAADAVQKAKSGHPGLPLGCAAVAYDVWAKEMKHNPANPDWVDRDRFILSGGHGSTLLYSLLHLFGYGLTKEDLMQFRQWGSLTPGHPEYRHTKGVEATTGPLGAGMAMAVGMAMAEAHLAAKFNKENYPVVDHYTYVLGGDGCMMEGISSEAFSLAGTLGLSKLIVIYDSNKISIEGYTVRTTDASPAPICRSISEDGYHFRKDPSFGFTLPERYTGESARDPKVILGEDGLYHMILTTTLKKERRGCLAHFVSRDLDAWEDVGEPIYVSADEAEPECPDYFKYNGRYYLIYSLHGVAHYLYSEKPFADWRAPRDPVIPCASVPKGGIWEGKIVFTGFNRIRGYAGTLTFRSATANEKGELVFE